MITYSLARSDWIVYGDNGEKKLLYEDKSLRKTGSVVKMWIMRSSIKEDNVLGKNFKSNKSYSAYDCKNETIKLLSVSFYSGEMGSGEGIFTYTYSDAETQWNPIVPSSVDELTWRIACNEG